MGYIRNHWDALNVYARDGRVPIDNNRVEQLMREVAIGRKNWLFVGNVESGERAARLMTIVSSAKRHQLDVWHYLKDVLSRLLAGETDYMQLLPDKWKQSHPRRYAPIAKPRVATKPSVSPSPAPNDSWPPKRNTSKTSAATPNQTTGCHGRLRSLCASSNVTNFTPDPELSAENGRTGPKSSSALNRLHLAKCGRTLINRRMTLRRRLPQRRKETTSI